MASKPRPKKSAATTREADEVASTEGVQGTGVAPPPAVDPAAADAVSKLTALQLDSYAQTFRALTAPTEVDAAAADPVSIQSAARFSSYAEMFEQVSARFAAAHEMLVKGLTADAGPDGEADPTDATPAT